MIVLHFADRVIKLPRRMGRFQDDFVESEHPRSKTGEFAKKGQGETGGGSSEPTFAGGKAHPEGVARNKVSSTLKAAGFKKLKQKTANGHFLYQNKAGEKVYVGPHKVGAKIFHAWVHHPSGKSGSGYEAESLQSFLKQHQASGAEQPKPTPTGASVKHKTNVTPLVSGYGFTTAGQLADKVLYTGKMGQLTVSNETTNGFYQWNLVPTEGKPIAGNGLAELSGQLAQIKNNSPSAAAPKTKNQVYLPAGIAGIEKMDPKAYTETGINGAGVGLGLNAVRVAYKDPANGSATSILFGTGEHAGKWRIWQVGKGEVAKGEGQESFNQAFEALHPRGEGGKFVAKPGAAGSGEAAPEHKGTEYEPTIVANGFTPAMQTAGAFIKYNGPGESKLYIDTENNWVFYPVAGQMGVSGKGASELAAKLPTPSVPAAAKEAIAPKPLDMAALTQVGPQKGSNPGGVFEDSFGTKYYVKKPQSINHVKNELLAAALYSASGAPTLKYHSVEDGSNLAIATTYENLKADNVSQLTSTQKAEARKHFALQAWLANWDAAGLTGDNVGVNAENKVLPLDFGGSLLYRAQGGSKLSKFTSNVDEWTSMRNPAVNKSAGDLYGDMTTTELQQSAKELENISDETIKKLVATYGPSSDSGITQTDLAQRLIERKKKILEYAKGTSVSGSMTPPPAPEPPKQTPDQLRKSIASWNPPGKPASAVSSYKGNGYYPMNALMRHMAIDDEPDPDDAYEQNISKITKWLNKASTKEEVVLYRGVKKSDYATAIQSHAKVGRRTMEHGFTSMSTDQNFSRAWAGHGGILYKIRVPANSMVATVKDQNQEDGEYEALAQRGTRFKITKIDHAAAASLGMGAVYEVELIQPHHMKQT